MHHTMRQLSLVKRAMESEEEGYRPIVNTRRHPRHATTVRVRMRDQVCECRGDISLRGFAFEWPEEMPIGAWVEMSVRLPGTGDWVHVWGRVLGTMRRGDSVRVRGWFARIRRKHTRVLRMWSDCLASAAKAA